MLYVPKNIVFTLFIVLYIGFVGALILSHYLTFNFPFSIQLINKPWSTPEKIVIGIIMAPIILLILLLPAAYMEEKHAEEKAQKGKLLAQEYTENMQISIIKITEPSTWSKVYHCHIKSDKIDTDCKIVCYKDSQTIKSVIFPKEWREKNQEIYNYYAYIANIIKDKLKEFIFKSF